MKPFRGAQLNRTHPLAKGLVGCWIMNEGTGQKTFDVSGNNNLGTLTNMTQADWVPGTAGMHSGFALDFDGSDDYVDVGNKGVLDCATFTVFAVLEISGHHANGIVSKVTPESFQNFIVQGWVDGNTYTSCTIGGVPSQASSAPTSTPLNRPYSVMSIHDGSNLKLYLDCTQVGSVVAVGSADIVSDNLKIGYNNSLTFPQYLDGIVYCSYVWNRPLSPHECNALQVNPYAMFSKGINLGGVAYYSSLPEEVPLQAAMTDKHIGYNHFLIEGVEFMWKSNTLVNASSGAPTYMLIDNVFVLI